MNPVSEGSLVGRLYTNRSDRDKGRVVRVKSHFIDRHGREMLGLQVVAYRRNPATVGRFSQIQARRLAHDYKQVTPQ